jgi:hypothetical protein
MFPGVSVCSRDCEAAFIVRGYLDRMKFRRRQDAEHNRLAYQQAGELSAWLSVYRFGISVYRKRAATFLNAFVSQDRINRKRELRAQLIKKR